MKKVNVPHSREITMEYLHHEHQPQTLQKGDAKLAPKKTVTINFNNGTIKKGNYQVVEGST